MLNIAVKAHPDPSLSLNISKTYYIYMPQEFSVGVIVFNGDKFLLLKYKRGHWGFVKGGAKPNETKEDVATREGREEAGLVDLFFLKGFEEKEEYFYKKDGQTVHKEVIYLLAETRMEYAKLSEEHVGFDWFNYEDAMRRLSFKQTKDVLKKAQEFLRQK